MTTSTRVIRDDISTESDPTVLTTKFDSDHEFDASTLRMNFADITASVYLACGDNSIRLDFGLFGSPDDERLERDFAKQIQALAAIREALNEAEEHITREFASARSGA